MSSRSSSSRQSSSLSLSQSTLLKPVVTVHNTGRMLIWIPEKCLPPSDNGLYGQSGSRRFPSAGYKKWQKTYGKMLKEELERYLVPKKDWVPFEDRMSISVYIRWGGRRLSPTRSDVNNRQKVIPDCFKKWGYIPDDNMSFFDTISMTCDPPGKDGPGIEYSIMMPLASWTETG